MTGMPDYKYPTSQSDWFIMGTSDYISRAHVDAEGCYSTIGVGAGGNGPPGGPAGKLWFVGTPKKDEYRMRYNTAFPKEFSPGSSNVGLYTWEGIWLGDNDYL